MTDLEQRLIAVLDDIVVLAMTCRRDMQGRLADSEHRRAFDVLRGIAEKAATAIPSDT